MRLLRPADAATRIANDADVLAQQRLFSAWMNGQIEYRELPGIEVGLVAGDDLVWAKGFGFADLKARKPMTAETKFRMASHSKLFTASKSTRFARFPALLPAPLRID